ARQRAPAAPATAALLDPDLSRVRRAADRCSPMSNADRASCARTLVIPMYREAARIAGTIRTLAASSLNDPGTDIILVDDASDDDTGAVARAALAATALKASILRLERNQGKGGAVRAGVLASAGRVVAFSDADPAAGGTGGATALAVL